MKALGYLKAHELKDFAIKEMEVPTPVLRENDILVRIKAVSINPVDYKIRQGRSSANGNAVILGWDASGVVEALGPKASGFKVGDEVYYAGDLSRDGTYAELHAVDCRIVAKKPKTLNFAEAAALPLTSLTAWEVFFDHNLGIGNGSQVLIIGGAGGVGSMAIQLLKAKTGAKIITTASKEATIQWTKSLGADIVLDYKKNLRAQFDEHGLKEIDVVFSTTHSDTYLPVIPSLLRPFGHFCLIDDPEKLDVVSFKRKALSIHWELMFAKTLANYELSSQGRILGEIAQLVDGKKLVTTLQTRFKGLTAENMRKAHELQESAQSIGKIVVEL